MRLDNLAARVETEAVAVLHAAGLPAIALEHALRLVLGQPRPRVDHGHAGMLFARLEPQRDEPLRRVLECVGKQVRYDALDAYLVAVGIEHLTYLEPDAYAVGG